MRALTGGTYRSRHINLRVAAELEDRSEGVHYHEESGQKRPYFEVLFVDESSHEDARYLRERLRELRRPEDQFIYDMVAGSKKLGLLESSFELGFSVRLRALSA